MFKTGRDNNWTFWVVLTGQPICSVCKEEIKEFSAGYIADWTREGMFVHYLHDMCIKKWVKHPLSITQNRLMVNFSDFIPDRAIPVFVKKPSFIPVKGDVSIFEPDKLPKSAVKDNRRYGSLLDGDSPVTIGDADNSLLDELERPPEDVDSFLSGLKSSSKKAIAEKNKALLAHEEAVQRREDSEEEYKRIMDDHLDRVKAGLTKKLL